MDEPDCFALKIPARLHRDGKPAVQDFSDKTEKLYRRCNPDKGLEDAKEILRFDPGLSLNRKRFSDFPADVLFDPKKGHHHAGWKIFEFAVGDLALKSWTHPDRPGELVTIELWHTPEKCMYPHTDLFFSLNGQRVSNKKQVSAVFRTMIKYHIRDEIEKNGKVLLNEPLPPD
jgi:hypothetical protein